MSLVAADTHTPALIDSIWYTRCPVPTASSIAFARGWLERDFSKIGIRVGSIQASDDPAVRLSHFNHGLPGLFREGGNIPPIWARARGQDTKVIGLTWIDEFQAILAAPDAGISGPQDLRGRRIALPKQAGARVDFARAMSLHGVVTALRLGEVDPSEVAFVDVLEDQATSEKKGNGGFHDRDVEAVIDGRADAVYVKGAVGIGVQLKYGLRTVVDLGAHPDPFVRVNNGTPRPVTVDRRTLDDYPDIVARYLASALRAARWAKSHAQDVTEIVAREVDRSVDDVRTAYGPRLAQSFEVNLDPQRIAGLTAQKDFLLQWGFLAGDFDVDGWIDSRPLAAARELAAD